MMLVLDLQVHGDELKVKIMIRIGLICDKKKELWVYCGSAEARWWSGVVITVVKEQKTTGV